MTEGINLVQARWMIANRWLLCLAIICGYLMIRSLVDPSWDRQLIERIWHWILPHILPTTGLVIAVIGANAVSNTGQASDDMNWEVRRDFTNLTKWLLMFYLVALFVPFIATAVTSRSLIDQVEISNYWLGPIQGLCDLVTGILFFSKRQKE